MENVCTHVHTGCLRWFQLFKFDIFTGIVSSEMCFENGHPVLAYVSIMPCYKINVTHDKVFNFFFVDDDNGQQTISWLSFVNFVFFFFYCVFMHTKFFVFLFRQPRQLNVENMFFFSVYSVSVRYGFNDANVVLSWRTEKKNRSST